MVLIKNRLLITFLLIQTVSHNYGVCKKKCKVILPCDVFLIEKQHMITIKKINRRAQEIINAKAAEPLAAVAISRSSPSDSTTT